MRWLKIFLDVEFAGYNIITTDGWNLIDREHCDMVDTLGRLGHREAFIGRSQQLYYYRARPQYIL